jgi:membrane protease YdiL (CAAX protease family)
MSLNGTLLGFGALWLVLDRSSAALGSVRGEHGLVVCAAVLAAALLIECALSRQPPAQALAALGFCRPCRRACVATLLLCAALLAFFPIFELATGSHLSWHPDALVLAAVMFAQGGIAEELVFRSFLFRRVRVHGSFWQAAIFTTLPFFVVHLPLLATLHLPVAVAAILLSLSLSFPLAWLFERGGGSIWLPALVHAVVQGAIKLVEPNGNGLLALYWIGLAAVLPWALFALRNERELPSALRRTAHVAGPAKPVT